MTEPRIDITREILCRANSDKNIREFIAHLQREFPDNDDKDRPESERWINVGPGTLALVLAQHVIEWEKQIKQEGVSS